MRRRRAETSSTAEGADSNLRGIQARCYAAYFIHSKAEASAVSTLIQQLLAVLAAFEQQRIRYAAIGGLAVVAHGVVRATEDLDFLVDAADREALAALMTSRGFQCLHSSLDAANYASDECRVDFLFAHRPIAIELLSRATSRKVLGHRIPVVDVEGIVGLKLQAYVNDPRRALDASDIRALLSLHRAEVDWSRVRSYFALFDREELFEQWRREIQDEVDDAGPM